MPRVLRELEAAFLDDHERLTRGLELVARSLEAGDLKTAVAAAEALDESVGPHVRFEEEELYPRLREKLGEEYVERLYAEHEEGRQMIATLLAAQRRRRLKPEDLDTLTGVVRTSLDHVLTCGSLLDHLGILEHGEQRVLLERLLELRRRPARWSDTGVSPDRGHDVG